MKERTRKRITHWFWAIITIPVALFALILLLVWAFADIPSFEELENPENKLATQVIAEGGEVLCTFHLENRSYVSYEDISPNVIHAVVATEDVRFYKHSGVDFRSLGRVAFKTVLLGKSRQGGGSTVTQQLAKTLYPREDLDGDGKFVRTFKLVKIKLKEWITAAKIERDYTKDEIMDMYLNAVEFGSQSFGIKAAAQTFFAKNPSDLTVEESATLVGMINKPTLFNPARNPISAKNRRDFVISQMRKAGYIESNFKRDSLCAIPITLSYQLQDHNAGIGPYFRDMLRRTMNAKEPKKSSYRENEDYVRDSLSWADDPLYGWLNKNKKADGSSYNLDKDGLKIYTTINYKMQQYAEEAVAEHLGSTIQPAFFGDIRWKRNKPFSNNIDQKTIDNIMAQARRWSDRYWNMDRAGKSKAEILKSFDESVSMRVFSWDKPGYIDAIMTPNDSILYYKSIMRAGFVAIEPYTGHVLAYVGGPNYRFFKYDNLRQGKRQVGSTIKPFLYTLAMQEGMSPCDKVSLVPQTFIVGKGPDDVWTPQSTDKDEMIGRTVTLKWGLTNSSNNVSAYLMKQFGPAAMVEMMRKMGISNHLEEVPSLCVGACDLPPFDMVAAYNTYPSRGVYIEPLFVTRIEDNMGNVIGEFQTHKREAVSEQTAYLMANLMQGVVNHGTAHGLRSRFGLTGEIAGKTGTTNDQSDGWFIGYTPKITAGVWVGAEDRQVHFESLALGSGANMALPIWGIFMTKVLKDGSLGISEYDKFTPPIGMRLNLDCDGSDTDTETVENGESIYFD